MADRRKKIPLEKFFPNGFDKTNPDDMIKLTVLIQEKAAKNPEFEGYSVFSVDSDNRYAIIAPMDMDSDDINNGIKAVRLSNSECADTASQKKTVQNLESQPQYEGYSVVDFVRISSSEFLVLLQQLDEKAAATRRIFANVLKVKPWEIRISRTPENGWKIRIKENTVLRIRQANAGSRRSGRQKRLVLQGRPRKRRHHGVSRHSPDFSCDDNLPETADR